jgi:hypothetical protein
MPWQEHVKSRRMAELCGLRRPWLSSPYSRLLPSGAAVLVTLDHFHCHRVLDPRRLSHPLTPCMMHSVYAEPNPAVAIHLPSCTVSMRRMLSMQANRLLALAAAVGNQKLDEQGNRLQVLRLDSMLTQVAAWLCLESTRLLHDEPSSFKDGTGCHRHLPGAHLIRSSEESVILTSHEVSAVLRYRR